MLQSLYIHFLKIHKKIILPAAYDVGKNMLDLVVASENSKMWHPVLETHAKFNGKNSFFNNSTWIDGDVKLHIFKMPNWNGLSLLLIH